MSLSSRYRRPVISAVSVTVLRNNLRRAVILALCLGLFHTTKSLCQVAKPPQPATPHIVQPAIERRYQEGETVVYKMQGVNEGHLRTVRYEARAEGSVKKDPSGGFVEEFAWSDVHVNGEPFPLSPASQEFREYLSLAPDYRLSVPDLSKVQPILIGPITDLLAFYADVQLAMRQNGLIRAGDHVYVKYGVPSSWADGTYVVFGQDAVDFDITLQSIDPVTQVATLIVRHVPPAQPQIKFPAAWMLNPIGGFPNNWVEVEKGSDGKFAADVGLETFEVDIKISLPAGRLVSATMDNPVEVAERDCDDAALAVCGTPLRYRIRRQITLDAGRDSSR